MILEKKAFTFLYRTSNFFVTRNTAYYAPKKKKKGPDLTELKPDVEVETDANKLVTEVCGTNFLAEGGENIKIKPDSEYPDWLWKIYLGPPLPLEKLDPKSKHYWNRVSRWGHFEDKYLLTFQKHKTFQK